MNLEQIQSLIGIGILTFCLGIYRITNGRMIELSKRIDKAVKQPECHSAQEAIRGEIKTLSEHIDTRFDDLKDTVLNGKK